MKFYTAAGQAFSDAGAEADYRAARSIGSVRVGERRLFFRAGLRVYALTQDEIRRCYRRVMRVPMKMCCGSGNLDVEYLVIEGSAGELAQLQLPGTRAAQALMTLLKERLSGVDFLPPPKAAPEAGA